MWGKSVGTFGSIPKSYFWQIPVFSFYYFALGEGEGIELMHAYVFKHIVSLYYKTAWWIFTKLDGDVARMTPHMWLWFSA